MKLPIESKTPAVDALVVGAGVAGLLQASLLIKKGKTVCLTEKLSKIGGRYSPEERNGFVLGSGFSFGDSGWWRAFSDYLGFSVSTLPVHEGGALVLGSKGWASPDDLPSWENYLSQPCSEFPSGGIFGICERLLAYCVSHPQFFLKLEAPVTSLVVVQGEVQEIKIGVDTACEAAEVYWCADYKTLQEVLGGPGVPDHGPERVSWLKKFVKSPNQMGVILECAHKTKLVDFNETLVLPFSASEKEEKRYLVGSFVSNRDPSLAPSGQSLSSWVLPLTEVEWGDNHESMKKIRSARRLLEKAFPGFEQSLLFERVLVVENTVSPLGKKRGDHSPLLKNLFLGSDWAMPKGATFESLAETLLH